MEKIEHNPVLTYLAGFIDADGSICMRTGETRHGHVRSYLTISASQLEEHREPLDLCKAIFGGSIRELRHRKRGRKILSWQISGFGAGVAIKRLFPYFLVKKHQAFVALAYIYAKVDFTQKRAHVHDLLDPEEIAVTKGVGKLLAYLNGKNRIQRLADVPCSNQIN